MCFQAFQNKFFLALWASFGLQIRGEGALPWIHHWKKEKLLLVLKTEKPNITFQLLR